jgi:hypothetical protein
MTRNTRKGSKRGRAKSTVRNQKQEKGEELERLVRLLESVLSAHGTQLRVRHKLTDRSTGQPREVDIYIEETLRGQTHRSIIECRNHGKPVNVEYVEQLVTKKADIGDPFTYVVSKSGFTKGAIKKATFHSIGLSTLSETADPLWPEWVTHHSHFELRLNAEIKSWMPVAAAAIEQRVTTTDELKSSKNETKMFLDKDGVPRASLLSIAEEAVGGIPQEDIKVIRQNVCEKGPATLRVNGRFAEPRFLRFGEGLVELAGVCIELQLAVKEFPLSISFGSYRDITNKRARAESASMNLEDGTMVSIIKDPATHQTSVTASPPPGRQDVRLEIVVIGEDEQGREIVAKGVLVSDTSTQPPKLIIPMLKPSQSEQGEGGGTASDATQ